MSRVALDWNSDLSTVWKQYQELILYNRKMVIDQLSFKKNWEVILYEWNGDWSTALINCIWPKLRNVISWSHWWLILHDEWNFFVKKKKKKSSLKKKNPQFFKLALSFNCTLNSHFGTWVFFYLSSVTTVKNASVSPFLL